MPTVRLDHTARFGQPLLVLVSFYGIQQVGVAGELDQIRMGGDRGLAPVDERVVRGEEIGDVAASPVVALIMPHVNEWVAFVSHLEPKPLVQPLSTRVDLKHHERDRDSTRRGLGYDSLHHGRANAAALQLRQDLQIDDVK